MEKANQKHILVLITNPFALINVIHSGLIGELAEHYRISVMSDLLTIADIERFNRHFGLNMTLLPLPVPTVSKPLKWVRSIQMLLFGHHHNVDTIRIKLMERSPLAYRLFSVSQKSPMLIFLSGTLLGFIRNWLIRRTTLPGIDTLVAKYHIQAVISTSPLDLRENTVANSLNVHGIPIISIIVSWDNLTSKGVINSKSDLVLVWNKQVALEYNRFYTSLGDHTFVRIAGIPRFDTYFRKLPDRRHHLADSAEPHLPTRMILFATGAVKHHTCQNYIIRDLIEYAQNRPEIMILVRCHPGDDPRRYNGFTSIQNIRFFQPFGQNQIPPADFLEMLHSQLITCAVCVQVASTMLLDAFACNKPCISIAYDAHEGMHYAKSVRRFYDYSHQQLLPDYLKAQTVYHRRELFEKLDEIMLGRYAPGNLSNALKQAIHHTTPDSVQLTTQYIREWLG
ncbi:hypothetical protein J2Y45_004739 [Dyadobacter sp. BE34]|uniref:Capsule polysaccharide biosynthesis protein n=1 Tax=Dyadobacter fermentans TaxID=94254 RepID=A0ABU1R2B4_9BACT|nr:MULTISPECIES: hypothetical protein [Dyadobacter]MDR6807539.1 hypothetical protein [Dyadobacter fermentans]MDR7045280.1 hypothetical protein [Dyadobacter sp. BE242]MDR7199593.1 hypothetical protein [Dyadobacter sp. BE34]MDR7217948.1 hypothetical protein [Dyadobacter sp. BE31]MDR7265484.1 hypothetical protein [Dyadobacter sp. BE32]